MTDNSLTQSVLKELLDYDMVTGVFTWRHRDRIWFSSDRVYRAWNSKMSGKKASSIDYNGYVRISVLRKRYRAHRLVFLYVDGRMPAHCVDHINGSRDDNRYENLRLCSTRDNNKNKMLAPSNKSGVTGVFWYERYKKWQAYINDKNGRAHLGYFPIFEDAVLARKQAEIELGYHKNHGRRI